MEQLFSCFSLVALSEVGDKTQLLAFSLAATFRKPIPILLGILTATLLNHGLASYLGSWVSAQVPPQTMAWFLAAAFIAFGIWTLRPDSLDRKYDGRYGPYLTTTVIFFLAEIGDKTQLATIALAAKYNSVWRVTMGTTLGMLASDGLAVFLGDRFAKSIDMKWVRRAAAALFFAFGIWSALQAWSLSNT